MDDLIELFGAVLLLLHDANKTSKLRKWFCFQLYVKYLEQIVFYGKLTVSENHIHAFRNFKFLSPLRKLHSLLGACNVYEKFTKKFVTVGRPSNRLTQKDASNDWESSTKKHMKELEPRRNGVLPRYDRTWMERFS